MRLNARTVLLGALSLLAAQSAMTSDPKIPDPPQVEFKDLFVAVQMQSVFTDGKAFPDAIPQSAPGTILAQYHKLHPSTPEALKAFVGAHFILPELAASPSSSPEQVPVLKHIDQLWDTLTRTTSSTARYSSLL